MTKYYWTSTCARCGQGRLLVFLDTTADDLYLHCEECEQGWRDPVAAQEGDLSASFLTLEEEFESVAATAAEIEKRGWANHIEGSFEE